VKKWLQSAYLNMSGLAVTLNVKI